MGLHGLQHARLPCPSLSPGVCLNSRPLSWWCHPTIPSSVTLFCPQSFLTSKSFQVSRLFTSSGQSTGASASGLNIQSWFLCSKGLSRIFSSTTVQEHNSLALSFFIVQLSHPYMTIGKTIALTIQTFIYLERASYSQIKGPVSQDCPPPPHVRCQLQIQVVTCASGQLAINWTFSWPLLGFS